MTFWEALGLAGIGVLAFASFIGMVWWTVISWAEGGWIDRAGNLLAWILTIAFVLWRFNRAGGLA